MTKEQAAALVEAMHKCEVCGDKAVTGYRGHWFCSRCILEILKKEAEEDV